MTKTTVHKLRREHLKRLLNISMKQWNQQPILETMPGLGQCLLIMHTVKILLLEHSNGTRITDERISSLKIFEIVFNFLSLNFYLILTSFLLEIFYQINEKNFKDSWFVKCLKFILWRVRYAKKRIWNFNMVARTVLLTEIPVNKTTQK